MLHSLVVLALLILFAQGVLHNSDAAEIDKPNVQHLILVVLENQDYESVVGHKYFADLAVRGALFTDSSAIRHPSYPNYVALIAGDPRGIWNDTQIILTKRSIADLLEAKNLTWKNYAEGYPGGKEHCFLGDENPSTGYVRRHVPFLSFETIQKSQARCANVVDGTQFTQDKDQHHLPTFAFYSPDLCHSGHGGQPFCAFSSHADERTRLNAAATWLDGFLTPLLGDRQFMQDAVVIVTFDEADNSNPLTNKVYTVFLGGMIKPGRYNEHIDHYRILRTVEYLFSLGTLGENDDHRDPILTVWK